MCGSIIKLFFASNYDVLLYQFSLWSCWPKSLYLPVIKTTVSFTDRHIYKCKVQRPRPAYRKVMIPNQRHFMSLTLFVIILFYDCVAAPRVLYLKYTWFCYSTRDAPAHSYNIVIISNSAYTTNLQRML